MYQINESAKLRALRASVALHAYVFMCYNFKYQK